MMDDLDQGETPPAVAGLGWSLTRVRTRGAHRAGARRVGQGLYSQPREEGLTLALQRLARAPSAYFVVLLA